jgi:hypothetical protein
MKKVIFTVSVVVMILLGAVSPTMTMETDARGPEKAALAESAQLEEAVITLVSEREDIPRSRLEIGILERVSYPLSGKGYFLGKVVDRQTGNVYGAEVDENGQEINAAAIRDLERTLQNSPEGRLEPALKAVLMDLSETETVQVGIWLKTPDIQTVERPAVARGFEAGDQELENGSYDDLHAEAKAMLKSQMQSVQSPILDAISNLGRTPLYVSPVAPLVYVELTSADIYDMAARDDVSMIYGPNEYADIMNAAKPTHKADLIDDVWGIDGNGVDLGILEDSRIEFNNPYLNSGTTRVPGDSNVDQHATATGGMVASQNATYQGIAQGVSLYSANATDYTDPNLSAAIDWAASTQNLDVINNSWGSGAGTGLNVHARHLDYVVRNLWSTVTVSAGNDGTSSEYVGNPGRAYNVITVGAFDDNGTVTWDDDFMASYSSWRDPSTGVDKPEVAASGSWITSTTDASPWIGIVGSGTSYSAPMVAGEAALMMEANSTLKSLPELTKAVIMATAVHNIEGSSRLSEYDGVGGVDMHRAVRLADDGPTVWDVLDATEFPYEVTQYLKKGEHVRAVIVWDSNPSGDPYDTDPLEADLDFSVVDPVGTTIQGSYYVYNNFEILEFTTTKSGIYTFRITKYTFDGTSEYVGMAIWPGDRKTVADFDKDYNTDVAVYRPGNGNWYIKDQSSVSWGATGDLPVPGDYDGDGNNDVAVFRPGNGKWYIKDQGSYSWGFSSDVPMPCDYNGDGVTDIAVYRPSNGNWYVMGQGYTSWGRTGDIPVPADYDGDGSCDIAVYRPGNGKWYILGDSPVKWGFSGDIPVPGDYDGDGADEVAVYRPSNGNWYVLGLGSTPWGFLGDIPVPGDYDGDGQTDYAVLRPSNGRWYINGMSPQKWYQSGDYPLSVRDTNADGDPHQ